MPRDITLTFEDGTQHAYRGAPDDITPAAVESRAATEFPGKRVKAIDGGMAPRGTSVAALPDAIDKSAIDAMRPTKLERLGRGFADVAQGVKQGALAIKDAVTGSNDAAPYTAEKTEELNRYERGRGPDAGVDLMRLGGNIAATAPAMMIPGGAAATIAPRIASGAAQGAAASVSMFTPEGESKLAQTLLGAGIGGAVPVVMRAGAKAIESLTGKFNPAAGVNPMQLKGELQFQLSKNGLDFNTLTADVQKSLLDDAARTLNTGGTLSAEQLARKVDIESVGAKGTQAAITRAPKDWQTMMNTRGISGAGEDIAARHAGDAQAMIDYLGKLRAQTGGKATTALEAGEAPIKALQSADAAKKADVSSLYEAYETAGMRDAHVPATRIADSLGRVADEIGTENIPPAVMGRLKEFGMLGGKQTKLLTVNEADKLNKLINNNNPGRGTPGARALQPIKQALDEALLDVSTETKTGVDALLTARAAHAQRMTEQKAGSGIVAAVDDVAPDKFVKKFIMDADTREMRGTLAELKKTPNGTQAISDIKGHLFDNLLLKATGKKGMEDVEGSAFSGRRFADALNAIPPEKLHALFSPSEVESLRTLQRASKYLTEEVPFSDVNHSKTTAAMANLLMKVGSTPLLGHMLSPIIGAGKIGMDWVKDAAQRKAVAAMLVTSAGQPGQKVAAQLTPPGDFTRLLPSAMAGGSQRPDDNRK